MKEIDIHYGNGKRKAFIEILLWANTEKNNLIVERKKIPSATKDAQLTHKRASLAGQFRVLSALEERINVGIRNSNNKLKKGSNEKRRI